MSQPLEIVPVSGAIHKVRRICRIVMELPYDESVNPPRTTVGEIRFEHEVMSIDPSTTKQVAPPRQAGYVSASFADAVACPSFPAAYKDLSELGHRLMDARLENEEVNTDPNGPSVPPVSAPIEIPRAPDLEPVTPPDPMIPQPE